MKYEKLYAERPHALGAAFAEVRAYFEALLSPKRVLDLGAGQGRDSLMIARLGLIVHAVDISPTGLSQLDDEAGEFNVTTEVADLKDYTPSEMFDVILIDRTLHMLGVEAGCDLIARSLPALKSNGEIYIIDEKLNIPKFKTMLEANGFRIKTHSPTSLIAGMGNN